jgi:hypothetical protein
MFVADLRHYLDLPEDTPGPARRLAEQLADITRAATAGQAGTGWTSALPCHRRPGNRACRGRIVVLRGDPSEPIQWRCSACGDEGVISNWAGSPYDLRPETPTPGGRLRRIPLTAEAAAALRDLSLLDPDSERLVYAMRADGTRTILTATDEDLDELIGAGAAEANHEPNRRRQHRLDAALDALAAAHATPHA